MKSLPLVVVLAVLTTSATVAANPLHFERYAVCKRDARRRVSYPKAKPRDVRVRVPKKRRPRVLDGTDLVTIDVSTAQAMPTRRTNASRSPATPMVMIESRNDYRCFGWTRGKAGVLRVIGAPRGAKFYGHTNTEWYRQDTIIHAGTFNVREAIPKLRRILERPLPTVERWRQSALVNTRRDAAIALADLGHTASAKLVLRHVELLEKIDDYNYYQEAVDALKRLDPRLAEQHALDVLIREEAKPTRRRDMLNRTLLPLISTKSVRARTVLETMWNRLSPAGVGCHVAAKRIEQGVTAVLDELRPHLEKDLRSQFSANCYSQVVHAAAPGRDPDELPILLFRQRWTELIQLLTTMHHHDARGRADPRYPIARQKILSWLRQRTNQRLYRATKNTIRFSDVMYMVALAHLGDDAANGALLAFIGDGKTRGSEPWIAAKHALALDIDGVSKALDGLLMSGVRHGSYPQAKKIKRGRHMLTPQGEVFEALARKDDPRLALGLLQDSGWVRGIAAHAFARHRHASACDLVGNAAKEAVDDAVQFSFWALTRMGDACRPKMKALAMDTSQPPVVRGMAAEHLAMMRDKTALRLSNPPDDRLFEAATARAKIIYDAPE